MSWSIIFCTRALCYSGSFTLAMGGGCWTCRARRKKCDGLKPSCDSCERLGIRRGGFGATKPSWMDNGAEQQRYCQDIKNQIKMQKRVRSKSNGNSKHPHLNQTRDEVIHESVSISNDDYNSHSMLIRLSKSTAGRSNVN